MSIHTILSQMEEQIFGNGEEVIEISIYRKDGKILSIPYHTVKKGLEVFAIRIVEEAEREAIELYSEHLISLKGTIDISKEGERFTKSLQSLSMEQRIKLQKMKG